ncbi:uncharacterized protein KY384_006802 [Bacidia gigantensis]|uniref:uncharacterized protein n=1 Tax=Bacidia gigantensis TaxID=2732470 RepID=UPI001D044AC2|nr:uncharacterized protein KY384_006802 [Bacidia gigantensis]KAG8527886.1 hypothetical protein KY384_006802 [Bacidia gigantensis]
MSEPPSPGEDPEKGGIAEQLHNSTIKKLTWDNVTVTVKDRKTGDPKNLLENVGGNVSAGEVLALMGPSGSGKTTLLNLLARRTPKTMRHTGNVLTDGISLSQTGFQEANSFVEQGDALIGSLTVRETVDFSARLSMDRSVQYRQRLSRVDELLRSFGLTEQAHALIGTPLRSGISGGQKRRTSVAAQLVTDPKILFLDEPTSGLDSAASFEVISYLKDTARRYNLLVIVSIHQPSSSTFQLFDKLLLLSQGKMCYFGSIPELAPYFASIGISIPSNTNPAEYLLELINLDFSRDPAATEKLLENIYAACKTQKNPESIADPSSNTSSLSVASSAKPSTLSTVLTLLHRLYIKSYRDVIAYGVRLAMYTGLAIMMGTVWLRLPATQSSIQPFTNAIFFGSAFMSFMAVAYVPAFLEDRATFAKDRANGLYGAFSFNVANFLIGLPYLFIFSIVFSVIVYWLVNLKPEGGAFMRWVMWVFLDLVAAESLVVLVSSLFPIFVVALAIVAFANGLWMSVGGFLVSPTVLNVFWRYVFHYIDYQAYVFQGMMVNEFAGRSYTCGDGCRCMYDSPLKDQCKIDGKAVLKVYGYRDGRTGKWVGILVGIIAVYRLLGFLALHFRK